MGIGYGKLLLFGEHAVVHGHPAVGTGTDLHTEITFDPDEGSAGRGDTATGETPGHPGHTQRGGGPGNPGSPGPGNPRKESGNPRKESGNPRTSGPGNSGTSGPGNSGTTIVIDGRRVTASGLHPDDAPSFVEALEAVRGSERHALREPRSLRLESNVPRGVGLGSSSALCAALAAELLGATTRRAREQDNSPAPEYAVWRLAHRLEHVYHGTPSGVDTCLSTFGGLRAVYPQPDGAMPRTELLAPAEGDDSSPAGGSAMRTGGSAMRTGGSATYSGAPGARPGDYPTRVDAHTGLAVVYGYLPRSGDTRALVGKIRTALEDGSRDVHERLEALGRISGDAIEVLRARRPDAGVLGVLANEAQRHLEALGLSNEALRAVLAAGTGAGALGGKLSGAGGGGAWFLVFENPQQAERGRQAIVATVGEIPAFTLPIGR